MIKSVGSYAKRNPRTLVPTRIGSGNRYVTCRKNTVGEWVCRLWVDGKHYKPADYFTTDAKDASDTMQAMYYQGLNKNPRKRGKSKTDWLNAVIRKHNRKVRKSRRVRKNPAFKAPGRRRYGSDPVRMVAKTATQAFSESGGLRIRYHNTDIVVIYPDRSVRLNSGGWHTVTTKRRMNEVSRKYNLGFSVWQKKHKWYVSLPNGTNVPFVDGMGITPSAREIANKVPLTNPRRRAFLHVERPGIIHRKKFLVSVKMSGAWKTVIKTPSKADAMRVAHQWHRETGRAVKVEFG